MDCMPYYNQMLSPQQCASPLMQYPVEALDDMYPDIYKVVYPRVRDMCLIQDIPGNPEMYPYPSRAAVERMADEIYRDVTAEIGEPDDMDSSRGDYGRQIGVAGAIAPVIYPGYGYSYYPNQYYGSPIYGYGFGGRRFLRDLIAILLIRNLLGRRGFYYY